MSHALAHKNAKLIRKYLLVRFKTEKNVMRFSLSMLTDNTNLSYKLAR